MPCWWHNSAVANPASPCFRIAMICSSLCRVPFTVILLFGLENSHSMVAQFSRARSVSLALLENVNAYRELHRQDWEDVRASVGQEIRDFDFYFDFVLEQISQLKPFWVKD